MTEQKPYRVEVRVPASLDAVWRALTEPDQISQWFGWDYDGLDAEIRFIFVEHSRRQPPDRIVGDEGTQIELEADGGHTVVRAVFPGPLDDAAWDDIYDGMEEGWRTFFEQLRFWLGRRPQGRRRTIYLTGTGRAADVLAAAGVDTGDPWHQSRYQRMAVDSAGHLVVVAAQQPLTTPDAGPISITVTTYGLADPAFDAVRAAWARRWQAVARDAEVTV